MLFADVDVATSASVLACFMAAISGLFAWLAARDKLRFDSNMVLLKSQVATLTEQHEQCQADHDKAQAEINSLRGEVHELLRRVNVSDARNP